VIRLERGHRQTAVADDLLPLPVAHADYISATERIAARVADISAQIALYRFGSIGCPGISDLDFLCVVPDGMEKKALRRVEKIMVGEPLATHGPFIAEKRRMFDLPLLFPGIQLQHVSGPDTFWQSGNSDQHEELSAFSIADIIEAGCRRWATLSTYCTRAHMGTRRTLLTLWALTHLFGSGMRTEIGIDDQHIEFRDNVFEMRNIVAAGGQASHADLHDLAQRGAALTADLVSAAARFAATVQRDNLPMADLVMAGRALLLRSANEQLSSEAISLKIGNRARRYELLRLPSDVYAHFSRCTMAPTANASSFDRAVAQRTAAALAYRSFLNRAGCHFAAIPPSPFIPSRSFASRPLDHFVLLKIAGQERTRSDRLAT
jgi:hypothetical protein